MWQEQLVTEKRRYDKLMADFRIVSQRNLVCGLHIHVAIPDDVDRIDVMNRAMRWLPVFLALSTSSPFWNHRVTGLLSYRQALYDEWPRSGIPDFFRDEADYQAFVDRMQAAGAISDSSQLWWAIRPALRFPTLEMRIADVCTRLEDALAIAALYRALVATLVANPDMGKARSTHTRRLIDENRWRAKRDGIKAEFILETSNEVVPVAKVVGDLIEACSEQIDRLDCGEALAPIERILSEGTSAHQQLKIYNDSRAAGDESVDALLKVPRVAQGHDVALSSVSLGWGVSACGFRRFRGRGGRIGAREAIASSSSARTASRCTREVGGVECGDRMVAREFQSVVARDIEHRAHELQPLRAATPNQRAVLSNAGSERDDIDAAHRRPHKRRCTSELRCTYIAIASTQS